MTRLGERGERPRPLRLTFASEHEKKPILRSTNKLKGAPAPYSTMSLQADMSRDDRAEYKTMLQEAKARSDAEDSGDWIHLVRGNPGRWKITT